MYAMTLIHIDIVSCITKFVERPTTMHWIAMKRYFYYLQGTSNYVIFYSNKVIENILGG
jgi:hypothetical protein